MNGLVTAVARSATHSFGKCRTNCIRLLAGLGVAGDAHLGATVQHRSRVAVDPSRPNLRQVHLVHSELFAELAGRGFAVRPGEMGENVTTAGLALLDLPTGTRLRIGDAVVLEVTGLRNPCRQLDVFQPGLMRAVLDRDAAGGLIRKAGIMAIVLAGGEIAPGDRIHADIPSGPHRALVPV